MHVGIRGSIPAPSDLDEDADMGLRIIACRDIEEIGIKGIIKRIRDRVGERTPLYLSVDIDVLDPAFAPGTGTPEIGGFSSREMLELLRGLHGLNVVGADVVEVSPPYDHANITALAAATLGYELLSLMAPMAAEKA